jgi:hypothetical protein
MLAFLLALEIVGPPAPISVDPFAFFGSMVSITAEDRRQLDRDQPIARILPGKDLELGVFATIPVAADGDRLIGWMRRIEALKKSEYVLAIGRFSDPPRLSDLSGLALDESELDQIRSCKPGDCGLKLYAVEMNELQRAVERDAANWKIAVQSAFRTIVLNRIRAYLSGRSQPPYADRKTLVSPDERFDALVAHSPFLVNRMPALAAHLRTSAHAPYPGAESFVYWSKERFAGKPMISATEMTIVRRYEPGVPEAIVTGKQIFGTHYVNASLAVTAIVPGPSSTQRYLAYVNRSEIDVLGGPLRSVTRWAIEHRFKAEAAGVLQELRKRLEQGDAP